MDVSAINVNAPGFGTLYPATPAADDSGGDASGWLSGMGDLFAGVGSAISSGLKATNVPSLPNAGSGWVFNPATNQYYNPLTGQAMSSTNTLPSAGLAGALTGSNTFLIIILAVVAFFFFRRKE